MTGELVLCSWLHAPLVLAGALALDRFLGEFPAPLHPVVWMGGAISALERAAPRAGRALQLAWGVGVAVVIPALFGGVAWLACRGVRSSPLLSIALEALVLKSAFAVRALGEAGEAVAAPLRRGAVEEARAKLGALCSRDASQLDPPLLAAAAVESLAENTSDSVVAPLLFWALLGVPGAIAYRAVNTLDARLGYRGHYEWLGKAPARLDDLLNLAPARLTAALLILAGAARGADVRRGLAILRRDGGATASPNAGRPMAAMAGLLGVQLEKVGAYRLGDPLTPAGPETIGASWRIAGLAAAVAAVLCGIIAVARGAYVLA
jgi:adenosylcobinamide-phosphate synthase